MMTRPSNSASAAAPHAVIRWLEDFGAPAADPVPDIDEAAPDTMDGAAELAAARLEAWNEGYVAACRAQNRTDARNARHALDALLAQAAALDHRLEALVEQNARALAGWLADLFVAALPDLSPPAMESRIRIAENLLRDTLRAATRIDVSAGGRHVAVCTSLEEAWRAVDRQRAEDPVAGDITIAWSCAEARIDVQRSWDQIRAALLPLQTRHQDEPRQLFIMQQSVGAEHVG